MVKRVAHLALLACACSPALEVPEGASLVCTEQCPKGFACIDGACVREGTVDTVGPRLTEAVPSDELTIIVTFSETVTSESAAIAASYVITPPLEVVAAEWTPQFVRLTVEPQVEGESYTLTAHDLVDEAGNPVSSEGVSFTGLGERADSSPPDQLLPPHNGRFVQTEAVLEWSPRAQAAAYTVDVATDASFTQPILGSPFSLTGTSLTLSGLGPVTYYWRVRADTTTVDPPVRRFHLLGDTIYVACNADPCDDAETAGNIATPRQSINVALADAKNLGITRVLVANRPHGAAYAEVVYLRPNVSLFGGYDPTFTTRTRTLIQTSTTSTVLGLFIYEPVTLDGFTIVGSFTAGPTQFALFIEGANASLTIRNVEARASSGFMESAGAFISRMSYEAPNTAPLIVDSELYGGPSASVSAGIHVETSHASILRCYMEGGSAPTSSGIYVREQAIPWILHSVAIGGTATSTSAGARGPGHYISNTIVGGQAPAGASYASRPTAGDGYYDSSNPPFLHDIRNNILFSLSTSSAVAIASGGARVSSSGNVGLGGAIFGPGVGSNYELPNIADIGFVDVTARDFHLTAATPDLHRLQSAAIDSVFCDAGETGATACAEHLLDFDGAERTCPTPGTDCWSRGAFEFQ